MIVNNKINNTVTVWMQKRYLGSGSSAEVYEYSHNGESIVIKFFKSDYYAQFFREVEIYKLLKRNNSNFSLEMLWYDINRLIVCTRGVMEEVQIYTISPKGIASVYDSLEEFHRLTGHIHRDIYHKNILQVNKNTLVINDFGLSTPINSQSTVAGNLFFASDRVLSSNDDTKYYVADDLFSLTFSLIFLLYQSHFSRLFNSSNVVQNKKNILSQRKFLINRLNNKDNVLKALKIASKGLYRETKEYIIKYLFHYQ
jgi:serine/threonine protein kinase